MFWQTLYSKLRADLAGSVASGGLTTAVLYLIDASGAQTDVQTKLAIAAFVGWVGGKVAGYLRTEQGPSAGKRIGATPPGGTTL